MWCGSKLVGSAGSASGYGMALDPAGGVVITGSSTADLTTTSVADGNNDSFVASYDANGNQNWIQQIQTLATNQANAVSVDASGNIYIGGSVSGGVIGAGQTAQGGGDAYLAKFDSKGNIAGGKPVRHQSGADQVSATAIGSDGSLYVASVQNGDAVVAKYANGDITSAPGLDAGSGRAVSPAAPSAASPFRAARSMSPAPPATPISRPAARPASPTPPPAAPTPLSSISPTMAPAPRANHVSYVGTSASDQGGAVTVGSDGTVYLAGTTTGTFAGPDSATSRTSPTPLPPRSMPTARVALDPAIWRRLRPIHRRGAWRWIPNGASVLDALGLPQRHHQPQPVGGPARRRPRCAPATRFQIKIEGVAPRTATITIDPGETLDSLVTKINAELGSVGKASLVLLRQCRRR